MCKRESYQKIGNGRHGGGIDRDCHKGDEEFKKRYHNGINPGGKPSCECYSDKELKYSPGQINALLQRVESLSDFILQIKEQGNYAKEQGEAANTTIKRIEYYLEELSRIRQYLQDNISDLVLNGSFESYKTTVNQRLTTIEESVNRGVKSITFSGRTFRPDNKGNVVLTSQQGGEGETPVATGGDAESVCGYKIRVVLPSQYNPDEAEDGTIYFIVKGENIIAIPVTVELQYQIGGVRYTPVSEDGWIFKSEPTECNNVGTYTFPISLLSNITIWEDGTTEDKDFIVIITPLIIPCPDTITLQETGNVISASSLCQLPSGLACSYVIKSGQEELRDVGTYIIELSLNNPNCVFDDGVTHTMVVTIEERTNPQPEPSAWKFGDAFPIVFGGDNGNGGNGGNGDDNPQTQPSAWKFGDAFPIVFGSTEDSPARAWKFGDAFPIVFY